MSASDRPTIPEELKISSIAPAWDSTPPRTLPPYQADMTEFTEFSASDSDVCSDVYELERLAMELPPSKRRILLKVARDLRAIGDKDD